MQIRHAFPADLDAVTRLEACCFPAAEAASREQISARIAAFGDRFWLMEENGEIIAMVNGMCSDERMLSDEMYADAGMHRPDGQWQMIFGVDTAPAYRHQGIASRLMRACIEDCRREGRLGVVLTCKDVLLPFYQGLGFSCEGVSDSTHGGATWNDMRLMFD